MLPKERRLTRKLFDEVMATGKVFHSPILSLKAIKVIGGKDGKNHKSHFAVAASKKYFKTAVTRNKMRRITYSGLAPVIKKLDMHSDKTFHCVLLPKPEALDLTQIDLTKALENIFVKSRILA